MLRATARVLSTIVAMAASLSIARCGGEPSRVALTDSGATSGGGVGPAGSTGGLGGVAGAPDGDGAAGGGGAAGAESGGGGTPDVTCTKKVHLHMSNFSWVAPLQEANGVVKNDCWTYEARGGGFRCDYDGAQNDYVKTGGSGTFASYNEIKPLHQHDAAAVSNCKQQSGGKPVRTYVVWNGTSWDNEGIAASVHFAEIYATQADRDSKFSIWKNQSTGYKSTYRPMINLSPETASSGEETYASVAQICKASNEGQWLGIYFYDPQSSGGAGMADWKRQKIIEAMNDCTTK